MSLIELQGDEADHVRKTYFSIDLPPNVPVLIHEIILANGSSAGFVATEDMKFVGGPHIFIWPACRIKQIMVEINQMFKEVYIPIMRDRGMKYLLTNCAKDDRGTTNFMEKAGFTIKHVVVAEYAL